MGVKERATGLVFPALKLAMKSDRLMSGLDRAMTPFNPANPARFVDPYPLYERARALGPVAYAKALDQWFITGADECEAALRLPTTTVDRSGLVGSMAPYTKLSDSTIELFMGTMLMRDPPEHTRLRNLVNRAFTPRAVASMKPAIEGIVDELLVELATKGRFDAVEGFADRVPIYAIGQMLGLPADDWDRFKRLSDSLVRFIDPLTGFDPAEMEADVAEFRAMVAELVDARRSRPTDDMLTSLVEASDDGDALSQRELESMIAILMIAGHETTAGLIGLGLLTFFRHPFERRKLLDRPDLASNAVEELMRFDAPVQATDRILTENVTFLGHDMKAGQVLGVMLAAANRDPRRHEWPARFDIGRSNPRPLSFGHGIHHCVGAALARLEAQIAIPRFLERFPDYEVDADAIEWKRSFTVRGPKVLPITP